MLNSNLSRDEHTKYINIEDQYMEFMGALKQYIDSQNKLILSHIKEIDNIVKQTNLSNKTFCEEFLEK